jgi:pimeloyl-ACP methyl ester carboxylesterase
VVRSVTIATIAVGAAFAGGAALLVPGEGRSRATEPPHITGVHACWFTGFTCGTLSVPLDHSGRVGGRLSLAVAVADTPPEPPRGFLLVLMPGQPGVQFATQMAGKLAPVLREYRLVLYDERGTGGGALQCPQLQAQMGRSLLRPPTAGAVRSCAAAIGTRRQFYGTDDVVADMELLRRALNADRWTLDGISYGSYVAERYALAHPSRVRRLVLDSVVPHDGSFQLLAPSMRRAAAVLRLACRSRPRCAGDPAGDLATVVRARHNGTALLDALVNLGLWVDWTYRASYDVPRLLHEARLGNHRQLETMLAATERANSIRADELSRGLLASKLCADLRWPWGSATAPLAGRADALRRAVERLPPRALWPFDRATALGNGLVRQCLLWPPSAATPAPPEGARLPNVLVLLLAGDRDLVTPIELARYEAAGARSATLVVVAGAGHSVQFRSVGHAGLRAIQRFLLAP